MDLEPGIHQNRVKRESWRTVLTLAYQSLGVVYGDLSTSPLYVYNSTFEEDINHSDTNEEIYGVCIALGLCLMILSPIGGLRSILLQAKTYKFYS